jgi:pyruvate dehydrogenase kinase 2/3/4
MAAAQAASSMASSVTRLASSALKRAALAKVQQGNVRLADTFSKETVDDIFASALRKQTGVSLKYM